MMFRRPPHQRRTGARTTRHGSDESTTVRWFRLRLGPDWLEIAAITDHCRPAVALRLSDDTELVLTLHEVGWLRAQLRELLVEAATQHRAERERQRV